MTPMVDISTYDYEPLNLMGSITQEELFMYAYKEFFEFKNMRTSKKQMCIILNINI